MTLEETYGCSELSVDTGEVVASGGIALLRARALGSCVAVTAYDPVSCVGALAHVMLPGKSCRAYTLSSTKYAEEAIADLMKKMLALGASKARMQVCLIGGGNVLGEGYESPGPEIVRSLFAILERAEITPVAEDVGGMERRSATLEVATGRVTYTIGDSGSRLLWDPSASADERGVAV